MNFWNSSLDCAAPPPEGPTPPSSAYCVHRSLSTISAQAANCRSATSPFESLPVLDEVWAIPSVANSVPADNAAPAIPIPFRNERRSTTRCQRASRSSVAVISVETVVVRFSFFKRSHSDPEIVWCNPAECKTPLHGRYSWISCQLIVRELSWLEGFLSAAQASYSRLLFCYWTSLRHFLRELLRQAAGYKPPRLKYFSRSFVYNSRWTRR